MLAARHVAGVLGAGHADWLACRWYFLTFVGARAVKV